MIEDEEVVKMFFIPENKEQELMERRGKVEEALLDSETMLGERSSDTIVFHLCISGIE